MNIEQIKSEAYIPLENDENIAFIKGNYMITYRGDFLTIQAKDITKHIYKEICDTSNAVLYQGSCTSIKEFRIICKLLKIEEVKEVEITNQIDLEDMINEVESESHKPTNNK